MEGERTINKHDKTEVGYFEGGDYIVYSCNNCYNSSPILCEYKKGIDYGIPIIPLQRECFRETNLTFRNKNIDTMCNKHESSKKIAEEYNKKPSVKST